MRSLRAFVALFEWVRPVMRKVLRQTILLEDFAMLREFDTYLARGSVTVNVVPSASELHALMAPP